MSRSFSENDGAACCSGCATVTREIIGEPPGNLARAAYDMHLRAGSLFLLLATTVALHAAESLEAKRQRAFALLWRGEYVAARAEFEEVLRQQPRDASARLGLAQSYYWAGDYRRALREFQRLPNHAEARRAVDEIHAASRPGFAVEADAIDDDQPYRGGDADARVFFFSDPLTKWELRGNGSRLRALGEDRSTAAIAVAGETTLPSIRTLVRAGLARFRFPDGGARILPELTAEHRLRTSTITLDARRTPLLRSAPAILTHAWGDELSARWARENGGGLQFAVAAQHVRYFDRNRGWSTSAYVLAPISAALRVGASAALRDTRESRFINGRYDPYYTPQDLAEARVVGAYTLGRGRLSMSAHLDAGIAREHSAGSFVPWRASLGLTMRVTPDVAFSASATHDSTAFYNANEIHAGLAGRF